MYVCLMDSDEWLFIPRDDTDMVVKDAELSVSRSGAYHMVTLCDENDMVVLRAVGRLRPADPASDRMVLDSVGARGCEDPPGGPWAVFSCASGLAFPVGLHALVAGILYDQIITGVNRLTPP